MAAIAAVLASSLLHVGAMAIAPEFAEDIQIQGNATEQAAALGSNFADLVKAGDDLDPTETEQDTTTEPTVTPIQPAKTPPEVSEPAPLKVQPAETQHAQTAAVAPTAYAAVTTPDFKVEPSLTEGLIPPSPVEKLEAVEPALVVPQSPPEEVERLDPEVAEASIKPVEATQTITPVEELEVVPTPTPKPKQKKPEKPKKVEKRKQTTAGNSKSKSNVNNKSGTQDGKKSAKAATSGKSKKKSSSRNSGNAAASNYPGKVYAKIARTRQRNAGDRGVAQVRFTVTSSGQATGVSIARSSGNAKIDRAAVAHVKRAAPFPKPPAGAKTRFVIPIEFRR
jgi:protein TonB